MKRPIVILGAAGFIGRHLAERFASAGHPVIAAVRRTADFAHAAIRVEVAPYDQSADFLPLLEGRPVVVHAASSTTPGISAAQPQIEGNLRTTLALVEALQERPCDRLVYLSSGGTLYGPRDTPAREDDPILPRSYHGAGKAAAEHFIHAWSAQYGGTGVVIRPSNVYGPGQVPRAGFGVVPTAFSAALEGTPFTVWGDGTIERDFLFIDDLINLVERATKAALGPGHHVFNAGSCKALSLRDLVSHIEATSGKRIEIRFQPARQVDIQRITLDSAKAQARLDWSTTTEIGQGLARTWAWIKGIRLESADLGGAP